MDQTTYARFSAGLPIPHLTALQERLATEIISLEALAGGAAAQLAGAGGDILGAAWNLAEAMDRAGIPRDAEGVIVPPYDYDDFEAERAYDAACAPWKTVEDWICRTGSGTGSALALAVCYLGSILGVGLDWKRVYGGTLDTNNTALVTKMLRANRPARLPAMFWRIFIEYRHELVREIKYQGLKVAP